MKNMGAILEAGGCDFGSVVKTTVLLADIGDFKAANGVYSEFALALMLPSGDSPHTKRWLTPHFFFASVLGRPILRVGAPREVRLCGQGPSLGSED